MNQKFFCPLPWLHLSVDPSGNVYSCCQSTRNYSYGSVKQQKMEELLVSDNIQEVRSFLLKNQVHPNCSTCKKLEDAGGQSLRQKSLLAFDKESSLILSRDGKCGFKLKFLSIGFSNKCNLKCRICNYEFSSRWYGDAQLLGASTPKTQIHSFKDLEEFKSYFKNHISGLSFLYFFGGEPMYQMETYQLLNYLIDQGFNEKISLMFNSNITTLSYGENKIIPLLKKFEKVTIDMSIDGTGEPVELMRCGTNWKELKENFFQLYGEKKINLNVFFTVSSLNLLVLCDEVRKLIEHGIVCDDVKLFVNILQEPKRYSFSIFTKQEKAQVKIRIYDFIADLKEKTSEMIYKNVATQMLIVAKSLGDDFLEVERKGFIETTRRVDKIRNENSFEVIPALKSLL